MVRFRYRVSVRLRCGVLLRVRRRMVVNPVVHV